MYVFAPDISLTRTDVLQHRHRQVPGSRRGRKLLEDCHVSMATSDATVECSHSGNRIRMVSSPDSEFEEEGPICPAILVKPAEGPAGMHAFWI